MKPYIGIGTIIRDHTGNAGKVIGYDSKNQIVTIRYANQQKTRVRTLDETMRDIATISYKEVQ